MRRILALLAALWVLTIPAVAAESDPFGTARVREALPEAASELLEGQETDAADLTAGLGAILSGTMKARTGSFRSALGLCLRILGVVLLSAMLRAGECQHGGAMVLAGALAIGALCAGSVTGLFAQARQAVEDMTAFAGFLYLSMASATAATGAVGASGAIYGGTMLLCSLMTRAVESLLLPGISCCVALAIGSVAARDPGLRLAGDTVRQLMTTALKFAIVGITAYLSLTGVIRGTADTAAVKAAKLAISTAVPVVGSILSDASETLLVSASLVRSGLGVFGVLGLFAVAAGPFLETGVRYLLLKLTAAAASLTGEQELSDLIASLAGAMGLLAAVTGTCGLILVVGCVCFLMCAVG